MRGVALAEEDASPHRAGTCGAFVSGALLFAADVETFWYSRVFWLKGALNVVLLINGVLLLRVERLAQQVTQASVSRWSSASAAGTERTHLELTSVINRKTGDLHHPLSDRFRHRCVGGAR